MYLKHVTVTIGTILISTPPTLLRPTALLPVIPISKMSENPQIPWPWQSLDANWRSPFRPRTGKPRGCPLRRREGERAAGNCAGSALGWGQEKETSFLGSARRVRGRKGKGGGGARMVGLSYSADPPGLRPPREGGHTSTGVVGLGRPAALSLGVLQRREAAPGPVPTAPRFPGSGGWA